jgi:large subunit ribosomal protein L11
MKQRKPHRVKLIIPAQNATPTPPVGSVLGQKGINISKFCKAFNQTSTSFVKGTLISTQVKIFEDKTFEIMIKGTPTTELIKQHQIPDKTEKGIRESDIKKIANMKMEWFNTRDLEKATQIVLGTVKSMGWRVIHD